MDTRPIYRIIVGVIMICLIVEGWWFAALPLGLIAIWFFPFYIEYVVFGIMYDALFGMVPSMMPASPFYAYAGTISAVVLFLATLSLKKIVRR